MLWLKAFHIMAVIAWIAGLFYLPRLFVYHADASRDSELSETFKTMERRLFKIIMNPAMMTVWITGPWLAWLNGPAVYQAGWLAAKVVLVAGMTWLHHLLGRWLLAFANDANTRDAKFYRIVNEAPTLGMAAIVLLVVLKPF